MKSADTTAAMPMVPSTIEVDSALIQIAAAPLTAEKIIPWRACLMDSGAVMSASPSGFTQQTPAHAMPKNKPIRAKARMPW